MTTLGQRTFATGAGITQFGKDSQLLVTGTGTDGLIYLSSNRLIKGEWEARWDWKAISELRSLTTPSITCSANGEIVHVAVLQEDRRLLHLVSQDSGKTFVRNKNAGLPRQFISAPAIACSADGQTLWIAALEGESLNFVQLGLHGLITLIDWFPFSSRNFISAPALACSSDAKQLHVFGIDRNLWLLHRFSAKADRGRDGFKGAPWNEIGVSDFSSEGNEGLKIGELFY